MRILWPHPFPPWISSAGGFMYASAKAARSAGIDVVPLYIGNIRSLRMLREGIALVSREAKGCDIVHAQYGSACALATSMSSNRFMVTLRGSDWHRYPRIDSRLFPHTALAKLVTKYALRWAEACICVSNRIAREVQRERPGLPTAVLPSAIDLRRWMPTATKTSDVLLSSAERDNPIKRPGLARRAVEIASRSRPELRLRVATGVEPRDMPKVVASCGVALCTSLYEGWPNAIKEALACNVPFVSTDVGDLAEVAAMTRSCSVRTANPRDLADGIIRALDARQLAEDLRQHVLQMDQEAHGVRYRAICESVLKGMPMPIPLTAPAAAEQLRHPSAERGV